MLVCFDICIHQMRFLTNTNVRSEKYKNKKYTAMQFGVVLVLVIRRQQYGLITIAENNVFHLSFYLQPHLHWVQG